MRSLGLRAGYNINSGKRMTFIFIYGHRMRTIFGRHLESLKKSTSRDSDTTVIPADDNLAGPCSIPASNRTKRDRLTPHTPVVSWYYNETDRKKNNIDNGNFLPLKVIITTKKINDPLIPKYVFVIKLLYLYWYIPIKIPLPPESSLSLSFSPHLSLHISPLC